MTNIVIKIQKAGNNNLYRVLTDKEVGRTDRPRMPMVWTLDELSMPITKEWQIFLCAINPGVLPRHMSANLGYDKAFTNFNGFGDPEDPRRNHILNEDLSYPLPRFDKVRTCGNAFIEMIGGKLTMLDGNKPPELKPGIVQPQSIYEARMDMYKYTPKTHPHLFFKAVGTGYDGLPNPFPNGAVYDWSGTEPVTFFPHVSPVDIYYPPERWNGNTPTLVKV